MPFLSVVKWALGENRYILLRNLQYTKTFNFLLEAPNFPKQIRQQWINAPFFPFDFQLRVGMGAMLTHITQLLKYADEHSLIPVCRISNPLYSDGSDIFPNYFVLKRPLQNHSELRFHDIARDYTLFSPSSELQLDEMNGLFCKYIDFSERVHLAVEEFSSKYFTNDLKIGIHYRGTDKIHEAPLVNHQIVFDALERYVKGTNRTSVFLATDSAHFAVAIRKRFPNINFISFYCGEENDLELPRHFSPLLTPDEKSMEAIMNIILLSKCEICVRTASQLSVWSRVLNKDLKMVTVNQPYKNLIESQVQMSCNV
jgi:hypothetical protein